MIIRFNTPVRNTMAWSIVNAMNAGSGPATLKFYTAPMPADVATAVTSQILLGMLTCADPAATVDSGIITFASIAQDAAADASGQAAWARAYDATGVAVCDFDVTDTSSAGAIKLNSVDIAVGGPISMSDLSITVGA